MGSRYFLNKFADHLEGNIVQLKPERVVHQIREYAAQIVQNTWTNVGGMAAAGKEDPDLYVGDAGIAYMFLRMHNCEALLSAAGDAQTWLTHATNYIRRALAAPLPNSRRANDDACAFLCGSAGVHAVAAAIARTSGDTRLIQSSLQRFAAGFQACTDSKWDEILVGRAGFLSGVHWLNAAMNGDSGSPIFGPNQWANVCNQMVERGRAYAQQHTIAGTPLMYEYHGTEYLGAAHGLSGILQVMLMQPEWLATGDTETERDVWSAVHWLMDLQDADGNYPTATDSARRNDRKLVHWCHGAAGVIYLLLQAHRLRPESATYMDAARRAAEVIWKRGLLRKGPGICHGVAGSGFASLVMYRHTDDVRYLHRAIKCAEFLSDADFLADARVPDRPYSLYEGTAGTVCFLCDLLEPARASFPFMEVR